MVATATYRAVGALAEQDFLDMSYGFRPKRNTGDVRCPDKTTFGRVLAAVADDALERVLLRWQEQVLGPTQDRIVIADGKNPAWRRGNRQCRQQHGSLSGQRVTDTKSNEIPAARRLLLAQDLVGKLVLADALHTQTETARQILYHQGGN